MGAFAGTLLSIAVLAVPLGLSLWALLDAARRPQWAWALAGRRQVLWLIAVLCGTLSVVPGVLIAGYYLLRVRPDVAAAEDGRLDGGNSRHGGPP